VTERERETETERTDGTEKRISERPRDQRARDKLLSPLTPGRVASSKQRRRRRTRAPRESGRERATGSCRPASSGGQDPFVAFCGKRGEKVRDRVRECLSHSVSLTLSLSLGVSLPRCLSPSVSIPRCLSPSLSLGVSLCLSPSASLTLSLSLGVSLPRQRD